MPHTPGPWMAVNKGRHWNNESIDNWIITYGNVEEQIVDHCYEEADAKLIAAAPDLLAACRAAESILDSLMIDEDTRKAGLWQGPGPARVVATLLAAIGKATGQPVP